MRWLQGVLLLAMVATLGCSSGGGGGCDKDEGRPLASSAWPKFRADLANTGRSNATIAATQTELWVFPERENNTPPLANAVSAPVISADGKIMIVGGQNTFPTVNHAFMIDPTTRADSGFNMPLNSTASVVAGATPLLSENRVAVMFTDGSLRQFMYDGDFQSVVPANGVVTGSLTIDFEGTIYTATTNGILSGLCASGGTRTAVAIGDSESTAALYEGLADDTDDDIKVIGSNDAKVRAYRFNGDAVWIFTASAAVRASVVFDASNDLFYGVDTNGLVFALQAADGRRCRNLTLDLEAEVVASPALGNNRLYVIDTSGVLHALEITAPCDVTSPTPPPGLIERWTYPSGAPVFSSPALAKAPSGDPALVFGSDDGTIHAVVDQDSAGVALWTHCTEERGAFGQSSVAIGSDGTVYATTTANRLYAIGAGDGTSSVPCSATNPTPTSSPSASPSPTSTPGS